MRRLKRKREVKEVVRDLNMTIAKILWTVREGRQPKAVVHDDFTVEPALQYRDFVYCEVTVTCDNSEVLHKEIALVRAKRYPVKNLTENSFSFSDTLPPPR